MLCAFFISSHNIHLKALHQTPKSTNTPQNNKDNG